MDKSFEEKYNLMPKDDIGCQCGWAGKRSNLIPEEDVEQYHPANRNNPACTPQTLENCHWTKFEKCPKCKRCLFSDGNYIG